MTHTPHRLEVENASIGYGEKIIMRDLSFQVPHGARVAVVGPNGAGKSTLSKALVGILLALPMIGAVLGALLMWLVVSWLLHLVLTLLGGRGTSQGAINVVAWASLPFVVRAVRGG